MNSNKYNFSLVLKTFFVLDLAKKRGRHMCLFFVSSGPQHHVHVRWSLGLRLHLTRHCTRFSHHTVRRCVFSTTFHLERVFWSAPRRGVNPKLVQCVF